jgi:uncharacterized protein
MPISLHTAFIPSALQMLGSCNRLIDKAAAWCADQGCPHAEVIGARLHEDMLPFSYQVKSVAVHSAGAIEAVRKGVFAPDLAPPPEDFAGLRALISAAREALEAVDEAEIDGFVGQPMRFEFRDYRMDFTAENFLLSFSQPNLYFHAATAYDILRMKGVQLGKRDFLGAVRVKQG